MTGEESLEIRIRKDFEVKRRGNDVKIYIFRSIENFNTLLLILQ